MGIQPKWSLEHCTYRATFAGVEALGNTMASAERNLLNALEEELTRLKGELAALQPDVPPTDRMLEAGVNARNGQPYGDTREMVGIIFMAMKKAGPIPMPTEVK